MVKNQEAGSSSPIAFQTRSKIHAYRVCLWFGGFGPRNGFRSLTRILIFAMALTLLVAGLWLLFRWEDVLICGSSVDICLLQSGLPGALVWIGVSGVLWSQFVALVLEPYANTLSISQELTAHARHVAGAAALVLADLHAREGADAQAAFWRAYAASHPLS
ncbi:hypothetical protein [Celeribacter sp. SCSIO 80788]|uniref:hypothetical protein n=1 Tax=Celeribacter sp. SCSIO 80788 TaxID=3117013 RepID=UPI003DA47E25